MSLILIGGGSRSGKSRYALEMARKSGGAIAFIGIDFSDGHENLRLTDEEIGEAATQFAGWPVVVGGRVLDIGE